MKGGGSDPAALFDSAVTKVKRARHERVALAG
jgi:hypothetical protein